MKGSIHGSRNEFVYRISIAKKANYPVAVHSISVDSLIDVYGIKSLGDLRDFGDLYDAGRTFEVSAVVLDEVRVER